MRTVLIAFLMILFYESVYGGTEEDLIHYAGYRGGTSICKEYNKKCAHKKKKKVSICVLKDRHYQLFYGCDDSTQEKLMVQSHDERVSFMNVLQRRFESALENCEQFSGITFEFNSVWGLKFTKAHSCLLNKDINIKIAGSRKNSNCQTDLELYRKFGIFFSNNIQKGAIKVGLEKLWRVDRVIYYNSSKKPPITWATEGDMNPFEKDIVKNCKEEINSYLDEIASGRRKCNYGSPGERYKWSLKRTRERVNRLPELNNGFSEENQNLAGRVVHDINWLSRQVPVKCEDEDPTQPSKEDSEEDVGTTSTQ